jgi:hypothetical protein
MKYIIELSADLTDASPGLKSMFDRLNTNMDDMGYTTKLGIKAPVQNLELNSADILPADKLHEFGKHAAGEFTKLLKRDISVTFIGTELEYDVYSKDQSMKIPLGCSPQKGSAKTLGC